MPFNATQNKALESFKKNPSRMQLFFLEDKYIKSVCACWGFITRELSPIKGKPPEDENARWAWLWGGVTVNIVELAYVTGAKDKCLSALAVARANRLIYPDGTLNEYVLQLLSPEEDEPVIIEATGKQKKWVPKPNKNSGSAPTIKPMKI